MACADAPIAGFFASLGKKRRRDCHALGPLQWWECLPPLGLSLNWRIFRPEGGLRCGFFQRRRREGRGLDCLGAIMGTLVSGQGHHRHGTAGVFFECPPGGLLWAGDWLSDSGHWLRRAFFRRSGCTTPASKWFPRSTVPGRRRRGSIFCSVGIFISVVAQVLSGQGC